VIEILDLFDLHQQGNADSDRRITNTGDRLRDLEQRYERMHLVTTALWQLLKAHTGLSDADLKKYIEQVDLADGIKDGKLGRSKGAQDCPHCSRRILKSATVCAWCGKKVNVGDPFHAT